MWQSPNILQGALWYIMGKEWNLSLFLLNATRWHHRINNDRNLTQNLRKNSDSHILIFSVNWLEMFKTYLRKQADIPNASVQRDKMSHIWTLNANWRIMENVLFQMANISNSKKWFIKLHLWKNCFSPLKSGVLNAGFFLLYFIIVLWVLTKLIIFFLTSECL